MSRSLWDQDADPPREVETLDPPDASDASEPDEIKKPESTRPPGWGTDVPSKGAKTRGW